MAFIAVLKDFLIAEWKKLSINEGIDNHLQINNIIDVDSRGKNQLYLHIYEGISKRIRNFKISYYLLLHLNINIVVNQYYGADILMEYVIKGNSAVLKCSIPSFVADFVRVESWIDEKGVELLPNDNYG